MPLAHRHTQQRTLKGLTIGVAKETVDGEKRVVITPQNVTQLRKKGAEVFVQEGAGVAAGFSDAMYAEAGAKIASSKDVWSKELTLKVISDSFLWDESCVQRAHHASMTRGQACISCDISARHVKPACIMIRYVRLGTWRLTSASCS